MKITNTRWQCTVRLPVFSQGGVVVREEQCIHPKGHYGHHQTPSGGVAVNRDDVRRELGG